MNSTATQTDLIPDAARKPIAVLATWVIPQVVLLFLNIRACWLAFGEMSDKQHVLAYEWLGMGAALLLGGVAYAIYLHRTGRMISLLASAAMLAAHIAYLWLFVGVMLARLLPASVTAWIVPEETVLLHQFTFIMPAVFYAALRLACFPLRTQRRADVGLTLLAAIGIPVVFYTLFHILGRIAGRYLDHLAGEIVFILFVSFTAIMVMGLLRLTALIYRSVCGWGDRGLMVLGAMVGLVGPIAGLQLNRSIPFPVDFQSVGVYVLAIINGLAVTLPRPRSAGPGMVVWLLQCVTFPFTFYFFLVFLPFLPLSLLAVIAMGAGILMLVPTMLFALHAFRIVDGFKAARARTSAAVAVPLLLAGLAAMPFFMTLQALTDRVVIRDAVRYVYESDPATSEFDGSLSALKRTLLRLRDRHHGIELPYLTGYYDWLVFDGFTLSEDRVGRLHRIFFGSDIGEPGRNLDARLFGGGRGRRGEFTRGRGTPPPTSAQLTNVSVSTRRDGDTEKSTVVLDMIGGDAWQSECVVTIGVPEGVQVSGYWLHIGSDRVPGQLFEKKTALWVYQMIRDSERRDPGIMVYKNPTTIELRVFPFTKSEHRVTEIEFSHPAGLAPVVTFNDKPANLGSAPQAQTAFLTAVKGSGIEVSIPEGVKQELPRSMRKPYLHFILDRSAASNASMNDMLAQATRIAQMHPDAVGALVSVANYTSHAITQDLVGLDSLQGLAAADAGRAEGGLFLDRAIERALMDYESRCGGAVHGAEWATRCPRIIVITGNDTVPVSGSDLSLAARATPDINGYEIFKGAERDHATAWNGLPLVSVEQRAAAIIRVGSVFRAVTADQSGPAVVRVPGDAADGGVAVYEPASGSWRAIAAERLSDDSPYAEGVRAWLAYDESTLHPKNPETELKALVELSRATGVLIPATAYIVVENSAQWKMLALKEQQKLETSAAFQFKETPEPSTWALIAVAGALMVIVRGRRIQAWRVSGS